MTTTRKCFVANQGFHDYSGLAKFGETIFVSSGRIALNDTGAMAQDWAKALADSQPDDYLVPSGPLFYNMIGASLFATLHGRLNVLVFISNGSYLAREIPMASLMGAM